MSDNPYAAPSTPEPQQNPHAHEPNKGMKWLLFSFQGRARRGQFWLGLLIAIGVYLVAAIGLGIAGNNETGEGPSLVGIILFIPAFIFYIWVGLAVQAKRWHDRGKSAWWILIGFIPLIGGFWVLIDCGCLPGTPGPNEYGNEPS